MVRVIRTSDVVVGSKCTYYEYAGLNDDDKPTGGDICTGSTFLEIDTGDVYAYDEEGAEWHLICSLGGDS